MASVTVMVLYGIMISRIFSTWEPSSRLKGGVLLATKLILARYGLSQFSTTADDPLAPTVAEACSPKVRKTVDRALRLDVPTERSGWNSSQLWEPSRRLKGGVLLATKLI